MLLSWPAVVTRSVLDFTFSRLMNNLFFPPQPDYEQQLMDESRFRQQLEARNKSKKNERKHGIKFPVSSLGRYSVYMFFRWPVLLRPPRPDTQLRQEPGPEGEGAGEQREQGEQVRGGGRHAGPRGPGGAPPGLGRAAAGIHGQRWVRPRGHEVTATHCLYRGALRAIHENFTMTRNLGTRTHSSHSAAPVLAK